MADARSARGAAAPDLYAMLGVDRGAEPEVIDAAYRALARKYHPDVNRAPDAAERTRLLNEAYRTLHDAAERAKYDATLRLGAAPAPAPVQAPRGGDRPVDLFGAALADMWRGFQSARDARRTVPTRGDPAPVGFRRRLAFPALALGAGVLAGAGATTALTGRSGGALRAYWGEASLGRAAVAEARPALEALTAAGYAAAAGNPAFGSAVTQLIAALTGATARLRAAVAIPPQAEGYHFLQLEDWREERELRTTQREAIQNRNPGAWSAAAERETAWRTSRLHTKAEVAAAHLAALVAGL